MKRILTKRLTLALMTFAVACLASAVFLWGTEYKVSLYPHHLKPQPAVPFAKLLSEQERPASEVEAVPRAGAPALIAFFSLGWLTFARPREESEPFRVMPLRGRTLPSIRKTPWLIHFSFRPPPGVTP
ncbi:MAG TPA: hypothetical protein VHU89_04650 [Acidobacteriaceae bacterium]|jgi:hypothetical protein|nr:hypothetical protein [Acidobacteriaceae bacterium]